MKEITFDDIFLMKKRTLIYNNYQVTYRKHNKQLYVIDDMNNDTFLQFNNKKEIKQFVDEMIDKQKKCYDIQYIHEEILKDYHDNVAFHVSDTQNRESILQDGLLPNKIKHDVLLTSCYLDSHKGKHIPKDFFRTACTYLYKKYSMYYLNEDYLCEDLYMVDISGLDWRIGSIALSGYCLFWGERDKEEYVKWINSKGLKKNTKLYWKNCFSKEEFLKQSNKVIKADNYYGLDEILVMFPIEKERIKYMGSFTKEGFVVGDDFKYAVKDKFKDNYLDVLKKL